MTASVPRRRVRRNIRRPCGDARRPNLDVDVLRRFSGLDRRYDHVETARKWRRRKQTATRAYMGHIRHRFQLSGGAGGGSVPHSGGNDTSL